MRKNILAVAVLSAICGFAQADDVSHKSTACSINNQIWYKRFHYNHVAV